MRNLTAEIVFVAIMTVAVCIWLRAFVRVWGMQSSDSSNVNQFATSIGSDRPTTGDSLVGNHVVKGELEAVSRAIAKTVLDQNSGVEVVGRDLESVHIQGQKSGPSFRKIGFRLSEVGIDQVDVDYYVSFGDLQKKTRGFALRVLLLVKLPLFVVLGAVLWKYVVTNPNPNIGTPHLFPTIFIMFLGLRLPFAMALAYDNARKHAGLFVEKLMQSVELTEGVSTIA